MVKFCPKCGTADPDDEAVFCNKCGSRLPRHVPEKKELRCPRCGTAIRDTKAVFCDKCGSRLPEPPPVLVRPAGVRPAAVPPAAQKKQCPSCGAPVLDEISDYCNVCGSHLKRPVPSGMHPAGQPLAEVSRPAGVPPVRGIGQPVPEAPRAPTVQPREPAPPAPEAPRPAPAPAPAPVPPAPETPRVPQVSIPPVAPLPPVEVASVSAALSAESPGEGGSPPVDAGGRRPLRKWGIVAGAVLVILLLAGAVLSGVVPGFGPASNATNGSVTQTPAPTTATPKPTTVAPPAVTQTPVKTIETPVPTPVPTTVTTKPTATVTTKPSANVTTNATANVTPSMTITNSTQPLAIGQSAFDGTGKLTVTGFSFQDKMSDPTPSYAIGKKYLIIGISYANLKNGTVDLDLTHMSLLDGGGFVFDPASDNLLENPWTGRALLPNETRTGNLLFLVPPEATFLKLKYSFGTGSSVMFQIT